MDVFLLLYPQLFSPIKRWMRGYFRQFNEAFFLGVVNGRIFTALSSTVFTY